MRGRGARARIAFADLGQHQRLAGTERKLRELDQFRTVAQTFDITGADANAKEDCPSPASRSRACGSS